MAPGGCPWSVQPLRARRPRTARRAPGRAWHFDRDRRGLRPRARGRLRVRAPRLQRRIRGPDVLAQPPERAARVQHRVVVAARPVRGAIRALRTRPAAAARVGSARTARAARGLERHAGRTDDRAVDREPVPLDRAGLFVDAKPDLRSRVQVENEAGLVARHTSGLLGVEDELEAAGRTGQCLLAEPSDHRTLLGSRDGSTADREDVEVAPAAVEVVEPERSRRIDGEQALPGSPVGARSAPGGIPPPSSVRHGIGSHPAHGPCAALTVSPASPGAILESCARC